MAAGRVSVVGAGLGGLAAAVRIAAKGLEVDVYEKNGRPGGKASQVKCDGFTFDAGPSLLTMPFVVEDIFSAAGADMNDYVQIAPLETLCHYRYPDGTQLDVVSDPEQVASKLASIFDEDPKQVEAYFDHCATIYDLTADLFLFHPIRTDFTLLRHLDWGQAIRTLLNLPRVDASRTMHEANASFSDHPQTIQLFDRRATYTGSSPYQAPGTLNIIQHVDYGIGGYRVEGGVYALVEALEHLAEDLGVRLHCGSPVERIIIEGQDIVGLEVDGERVDCPQVISNADVNSTYSDLLGDTSSKAARRYKQLEPSSSAIVFYWGIDGVHDGLDVHNILFSKNYEREFADIFSRQTPPEDPTVYIYISSKYAPDHAPAGCENWFTMINAPYDSGQDWDEAVNRMREIVQAKIAKMTGIDIGSRIRAERVLTPLDLASRTNSPHGAIYGISSNTKWAAFLRQNNRSASYRGLYFCGGSAHPGGGMPLVLLSGGIAADLLLEDVGAD